MQPLATWLCKLCGERVRFLDQFAYAGTAIDRHFRVGPVLQSIFVPQRCAGPRGTPMHATSRFAVDGRGSAWMARASSSRHSEDLPA